MIDTLLMAALLGGYLAAAVLLLVTFLNASREMPGRIGYWVLVITWNLHVVEMGFRWFAKGIAPVTNLGEALSFFAWVLVGGHILLQLKYRVRGVGAFVAVLAALMVAGAMLFSHEGDVPTALRSAWLPVHVSIAFLGNAALGLAFVTAVAYLIAERDVRRKRIASSIKRRMPPLETLDRVNYRCVVIGFPLLTLGILTGALWSKMELGDYWRWEPRQVWSIVTWLIFAGLLNARITVGWRGKRTAILTIVGFAVILGSFLSIRLFDLGFHGGDFR